MRWTARGTAALLLAAAAGGLAGCSSADDHGYGAEVACEDFVKDRLKAPATADFDLDHAGDGDSYRVTGTVDAENSFGAKLRSDVTCEVTLDGDVWRLESLSGLD